MRKTTVKKHLRKVRRKRIRVRRHRRKVRKVRKNRASKLFREEYLPQKKRVVITGFPERQKKIIGEAIRRHPEMLSGLDPNIITFIRPSSKLSNTLVWGSHAFTRGSHKIDLNPLIFDSRVMEQLGRRGNLVRTLAHEFEHLKQSETIPSFRKKYKEDKEEFESLAKDALDKLRRDRGYVSQERWDEPDIKYRGEGISFEDEPGKPAKYYYYSSKAAKAFKELFK